MLIGYIIRRIYNLKIGEVILIGNNITLLDYEHQFMGSLYVMDNRSQIRVLFRYYICRVLEYSRLFVVEC